MKASPLLFAVALAICAPSFAADTAAAAAPAANRFAASIVPAERFEVGAMLVERHGQRGRPVILIPGLGSGPWAWQDTVREYSGQYTLYVVTLPGFDGRPAVAGAGFEAARNALQQLIASRKLDKPVLIGHSMGGALALALASRSPDLVGGVIAVDGLPVFPGTEGMTREQRLAMAQGAKASMAAMAGPMFASSQQQYMRTVGTVDMAKADELARLAAKSDPGAVSEYVAETLALDMRPGLTAIKAPVLVLAPYFEADAGASGITAPAKAAYYKSLMAGTPKLEVVAVDGARHFVMFDQPRQVNDAIGRFLKSL
jgi:pimeloyl-ACP methyl ester carboxylesterase